jgi:hypothetical protein
MLMPSELDPVEAGKLMPLPVARPASAPKATGTQAEALPPARPLAGPIPLPRPRPKS